MSIEIDQVFEKTITQTKGMHPKWVDSKYAVIKGMTNTDKGNFGENFTTEFLNQIGFSAERINGGIGDFDILLKESGITLEHKLATEDVGGGFQFNGLSKEKKYDYAFCLGVSPNEMRFNIYPKTSLEKLTTNMSKGVVGSFKHSVPKKKLIPLTESALKEKIKELKKNG